jgi:PAS domain S-box-containing protein
LSATTEGEGLREELETLREVAEKHRLLIETTDTGFVILDEAGRVLDANAEYVRLSGHERLEQIWGRPVTDWTVPEDIERSGAEVRRCLAGGTVRNLEVEYLGPSGRRIPVEINATARPAPAEPPVEGHGHVLVADDAPAVLRMVADGLARIGYRVTARPDGAAALAAYREAWRDIDLVLLDVMMPVLDGPSALAEMRRINPAVRAILASGHPPGPKARHLLDETGGAFLQKPFSLADLSRCAASVLATVARPSPPDDQKSDTR